MLPNAPYGTLQHRRERGSYVCRKPNPTKAANAPDKHSDSGQPESQEVIQENVKSRRTLLLAFLILPQWLHVRECHIEKMHLAKDLLPRPPRMRVASADIMRCATEIHTVRASESGQGPSKKRER
jgi:hypothetical protein